MGNCCSQSSSPDGNGLQNETTALLSDSQPRQSYSRQPDPQEALIQQQILSKIVNQIGEGMVDVVSYNHAEKAPPQDIDSVRSKLSKSRLSFSSFSFSPKQRDLTPAESQLLKSHADSLHEIMSSVTKVSPCGPLVESLAFTDGIVVSYSKFPTSSSITPVFWFDVKSPVSFLLCVEKSLYVIAASSLYRYDLNGRFYKTFSQPSAISYIVPAASFLAVSGSFPGVIFLDPLSLKLLAAYNTDNLCWPLITISFNDALLAFDPYERTCTELHISTSHPNTVTASHPKFTLASNSYGKLIRISSLGQLHWVALYERGWELYKWESDCFVLESGASLKADNHLVVGNHSAVIIDRLYTGIFITINDYADSVIQHFTISRTYHSVTISSNELVFLYSEPFSNYELFYQTVDPTITGLPLSEVHSVLTFSQSHAHTLCCTVGPNLFALGVESNIYVLTAKQLLSGYESSTQSPAASIKGTVSMLKRLFFPCEALAIGTSSGLLYLMDEIKSLPFFTVISSSAVNDISHIPPKGSRRIAGLISVISADSSVCILEYDTIEKPLKKLYTIPGSFSPIKKISVVNDTSILLIEYILSGISIAWDLETMMQHSELPDNYSKTVLYSLTTNKTPTLSSETPFTVMSIDGYVYAFVSIPSLVMSDDIKLKEAVLQCLVPSEMSNMIIRDDTESNSDRRLASVNSTLSGSAVEYYVTTFSELLSPQECWKVSSEHSSDLLLAAATLAHSQVGDDVFDKFCSSLSDAIEHNPGCIKPDLVRLVKYWTADNYYMRGSTRVLARTFLSSMNTKEIRTHLLRIPISSITNQPGSISSFILASLLLAESMKRGVFEPNSDKPILKAITEVIFRSLSKVNLVDCMSVVDLLNHEDVHLWLERFDLMSLLKRLLVTYSLTFENTTQRSLIQAKMLHLRESLRSIIKTIMTRHSQMVLAVCSMAIAGDVAGHVSSSVDVNVQIGALELVVSLINHFPEVVKPNMDRLVKGIVTSIGPGSGERRAILAPYVAIFVKEAVIHMDTIAFHKESQRLAVVRGIGHIVVYDMTSASQITYCEVSGISRALHSLLFSQDGKHLAAISEIDDEDSIVYTWKVNYGIKALLQNLQGSWTSSDEYGEEKGSAPERSQKLKGCGAKISWNTESNEFVIENGAVTFALSV
ncbi:hypothetical protein CANCADRAFT_2875 [Tortispora caseinolytica NRRL Y-17796]|uniref:Uncharacterized protein n=1 Tax=Tortispora caseinolytica NRRL Y-17796 TaxID=767744 RepID=A0A1E4THD2_9ASCO|nr:hypothetical protein CANCADRAFT_2875 [Tortispora caseinolytica NRRL Y-17796]